MIKTKYKLSILVPGWNAEHYIENCINSILKNDYENYTIILIVGGIDDSFNIALKWQKEYPNKIKVLKQEIPHKNKALNKGLKEVDGEIIVLTDIDCVYQKNWLSRINEIFQDQKYNVITGLFLPYEDQGNSLAEFVNIRHGYNIIRFKHAEIIIGNKLCGANAAFRKEVFFKKIGKFEEVSITGDDKILGMEFNKQGEQLYYFQDIYVYTELYANNLRKFIKSQVRWGRDLFASRLSKKQTILLFLSLCFGLFKFFYPIVIVTIAIFFFNSLYVWLFLIPWFVLYFCFLIKYYFDLKKKSIQVNAQLGKNFSYKKAFKIVPLIYFIFGIITIIYLMYPKRHKR